MGAGLLVAARRIATLGKRIKNRDEEINSLDIELSPQDAQDLLQQMPDDYRRMLALRRLGYSLEEIARFMNQTTDAMEQRLAEMREMLWRKFNLIVKN